MDKKMANNKKININRSQLPASPTEEKIKQIWEEIFEIQNIGIHQDFFDLGGDSFKAIQVLSRL